MRTKIRINIIFILCLTVFFEIVLRKENAAVDIDSKVLDTTVITSHMEERIEQGKNLLYCSTFQIAWNGLKNDIIKEDIRLVNEPPMVGFLNKGLSTKDHISDDAYVAMAGAGKVGIVDKLNMALREKFGDQAPVVVEQIEDEDIISYAFLLKNLEFKHEFERLGHPVKFNASSGAGFVGAFGIEKYRRKEPHTYMASQVKVVDYRTEDDFVVKLESKSEDDEIVLMKTSPGKTLLDMVLSVEARLDRGDTDNLNEGDTLQIPVLDFFIRHSYEELLFKQLKNKDFTDYYVAKAQQDTRFKLDEKGALLKSEAIIVLWRGGVPEPKKLIFDKPFLICQKKKNAAYPYFALWVDNSELMKKM